MTGALDAPVVVAGAGLAGLSAAYHLGRRPYRLIEREDRVGGLCRSVRRGGFTFDYTGHLLHVKRPEIRELVFRLLGEAALLRIDRRSGIRSHGVVTEYPFQANTHGLPLPVVRECVMGFAETLQRERHLGPEPSFAEWAEATFGAGIYRHFLRPYNEKLFRTDLSTMSADWVSWSIPKPSWADVVRGALGRSRKAFGYNPSFLYPAEGGIDPLPNAFLPHVRPELGTEVARVSPRRREVELSTGEVVRWSRLISTLPLPVLVARIDEAPDDVREAARSLRHVSVLNLNLGFDAPAETQHHWLYFPEPAFPFYRVGAYSNLCPASVPRGASSFYVEISHRPGEALDVAALVARSADALRDCGLVPPAARLVEVEPIDIPHAYVIHDRARPRALETIRGWLASRGIDSVGRYGAWEYSAMEDALAHGKAAAERALAA